MLWCIHNYCSAKPTVSQCTSLRCINHVCFAISTDVSQCTFGWDALTIIDLQYHPLINKTHVTDTCHYWSAIPAIDDQRCYLSPAAGFLPAVQQVCGHLWVMQHFSLQARSHWHCALMHNSHAQSMRTVWEVRNPTRRDRTASRHGRMLQDA